MTEKSSISEKNQLLIYRYLIKTKVPACCNSNSGPAGQKAEATPIAATMTETMSSPKCGDINIFTID